jgi:uncharacterized membrane protein YbhN (UPF0104 family)
LINSSSLLWRIFTVFLPALIGIVFGIAEIKAGIKKSHTKSSHNKN